MKEEWRDIKGYEGCYQVSNLGRVKRLRGGAAKNDRIRKPGNNGNGYLFLPLSKNNIVKNHYVHRLVATCFLPNPHNKATVNHKDGNKLNNAVGNLEWATQSENSQHGFDNGLIVQKRGSANHNSKPVRQYSVSGESIMDYYSLLEASEFTGISAQNIGAACNGRYERAGSFQWRFLNSRTLECISPIKPQKGNGEKAVLQYSKDGIFIRQYESCSQASRVLNICYTGINDACNGKLKTSGGYKWQYR